MAKKYLTAKHAPTQKQKLIWTIICVLFILLCLAAMGIKSIMVSDADLLGGKATVEKFFSGNLVQLIITGVTFVLFVVFFIKTIKDIKNSSKHLLLAIGCGIIVIVCTVFSLLPVLNISGELSGPKTVEPSSYTLCTDSAGKYYVAFDDDGGVLMQIPADKYIELMAGTPSDDGAGLAYDEVSSNSTYHDVQYYRSTISIQYYDKSVIYESASLT